jgi:hypothetical protein
LRFRKAARSARPVQWVLLRLKTAPRFLAVCALSVSSSPLSVPPPAVRAVPGSSSTVRWS